MPLGVIKPRELSAKEKKWRENWNNFGARSAEDWLQVIRHMSREEYFAWTYAIDPRLALILSTEPKFRDVLAYQKSKRWYHEVLDWLWRKRYGNY